MLRTIYVKKNTNKRTFLLDKAKVTQIRKLLNMKFLLMNVNVKCHALSERAIKFLPVNDDKESQASFSYLFN